MFPRKTAERPFIDLRQLRDQLGPDNNVYMRRRQIFVVHLPRWSVQLRINTICRADSAEHPHTHPMAFLSFIWRGWYVERTYTPEGKFVDSQPRKRWSLCWRGKKSVHDIVMISPEPVVTLFLSFVDRRWTDLSQWGFVVDGKLIPSKQYTDVNRDHMGVRRKST